MSERPPRDAEPGPGADRALIQSARAMAEGLREPARGAELTGGPHPAPDSFPGYDSLEPLYRGGQGVVYRARHIESGRRVALKVVRAGALAGEAERLRHEREVQILGSLRHPQIVAIHESGVQSGCHYFVMDLVDGVPLNVFLDREEPPRRARVELLKDVCEVVHVAQMRGVVHRDLKPGNLLVDRAGRAHVLDFGLARITSADLVDAEQRTRSGQFIGSLPWASPEHCQGQAARIDFRSDVYSLGVVMYQALSGQFPYAVSGNLADVMQNVVGREATPLRRLVPDVETDLETIVHQCLQKSPERRYQTAGELARDLGRFLDGDAIEARRDRLWYLLRKSAVRHWMPFSLALALLLTLVVGLFVTLALWRQSVRDRDRAQELAADLTAAQGELLAEQDQLQRSLYFQRIRLAQYAVQEDNVGRAKALLEECPPAQRGWEWQRLTWQCDRSVARIAGTLDGVTAVAYAPPGDRVAAGDTAGRVLVADRQGGELFRFHVHEDEVRALEFRADGQRLWSVADDGRVLEYDLAAGGTHRLRFVADGPLRSLALSVGEEELAFGDASGSVTLLGVEAEAPHRRIVTGTEDVRALAFDPRGGRVLAGGADGHVRAFATTDGRVLQDLAGHEGGVFTMALRFDGERLVTGGVDGSARFWDTSTGAELWQVREHGSWVYGVGISPYGDRVLTCGADHTVKVWDAASGRRQSTLRGHEDRVFAAAFGAEGRRVVSGGADRSVLLWDLDSVDDARVYRGHTDQVWSVDVSPDGRRLASASRDGTWRLWSMASERVNPRCTNASSVDVTCVRFGPDGEKLLTGDDAGRVVLWDPDHAQEGRELGRHRLGVRGVAWLPDRTQVLTAALDGRLCLWPLDGSGTVTEVAAGNTGLFCVAVAPEGRTVAVGLASGGLWLLDGVEGGRRELQAHTHAVLDVAFDPTGERVATASLDRTARLWEARSATELVTLKGHRNGVRCVAFSPDGRRVVTGGWDATVRVWDAASGFETLTLTGHDKRVDSVRFSPDGRRIVSASLDGTLRVWEVQRATAAQEGTGR